MDRLTMTSDKGGLAFTFSLDISCTQSEFSKIVELGKRLKAYEDTGLEPEEVTELATAKQECRLVVLPCKVGDTVYFIREEYVGNNSIQDNEVFEIKLDSRGVVFYGVPRRCSMDFMCYIEDLGKTVFLTREEAEAALKGGAE